MTYLNTSRKFGVNFDLPTDWNRSIPRTNILFFARKWRSYDISGFSPDGRTVPLSAQGSPRDLAGDQKVRSEIMWGQGGNYPDGNYVLKYDGTATIDIAGDASVVTNDPGRFVFNASMAGAGEGAKVILEVIDPDEEFEITGCYMPGYEDDDRWHPEFLASLQWLGFLRFMNWQKTNNSPVSQWGSGVGPSDSDELGAWSSATPANYWSQAALPSGVALAYIIDLANVTKKDAWICVPHQANDDYVTELARYVDANLDPDLRVIVEYTNEVWNGIFDQNDYCETQGTARGLDFDDIFRGSLRFQAERSEEIFDIFRAELRDPGRLVRMAASQSTVAWRLQLVLDWDKATQSEQSGSVSDRWDAGSTAPYFGKSFTPTSVSQILTEFDTQSASRQVAETGVHAAACASRGVEFWAYECGEHGEGANDAETQLFVDASRDAGMEAVVKDDADRFFANGGDKMALFSLTSEYQSANGDPVTPWGIAERQAQLLEDPFTPKWRGYRAAILQHDPGAAQRRPAVSRWPAAVHRAQVSRIQYLGKDEYVLLEDGTWRRIWFAILAENSGTYGAGELQLKHRLPDGTLLDLPESVKGRYRAPQSSGTAGFLEDAPKPLVLVNTGTANLDVELALAP